MTPSNFDRLVLDSDHIWIIEFYAPWCGHCQQLVPEYGKAATALKVMDLRFSFRETEIESDFMKITFLSHSCFQGIVKVGAVNADEHKSLSSKYAVRGFPTIKIFSDKNKPDDYEGARSAQALVDAGINAAKQKAHAALGGKKSGSGSKVRISIGKMRGRVFLLAPGVFLREKIRRKLNKQRRSNHYSCFFSSRAVIPRM